MVSINTAWCLCKQKRLNAELLKTKIFIGGGSMHTNFMNWQSDATQKEYNQTLDGIADIVVYPHCAYNELQKQDEMKDS